MRKHVAQENQHQHNTRMQVAQPILQHVAQSTGQQKSSQECPASSLARSPDAELFACIQLSDDQAVSPESQHPADSS